MKKFSPKVIRPLLRIAIREDLGKGDVTSRFAISKHLQARGIFLSKDRGILAGLPIARAIFLELDRRVRFESILADGSKISPGQVLARVQGPARSILAAERLSLNFLQRLSGIASLTRAYVEAVRGTDARIFDTRKTTPLWRSAEKYAVLIGGGFNHRLALESAVLLKDNHLRLVSPPGNSQPLIRLIKKIRARIPQGMTIEVEVEDLRTLRAVLSSPLDIIMLDNMTPSQMRRAVSMVHEARGREVEVEASGNVTLRNIRRIARTGVDRIAVGAITHSVQALDISLEVEPASKS